MSALTEHIDNLIKHGLEFMGLYYGSYEGIVTDRNDPENRGRIKIKCPKVYGDDELPEWVFPKGMMAGKKTGFYFIPQKDDVVWISFEGGNPKFPLWEFGWWLKDQSIEIADPDIYVFTTPKGHTWVVDEKNDTMYFSYKNGKVIEIKGNKISLGTKGGSAEPAALGDTLVEKLEQTLDLMMDICDAIIALTVTCNAPGSPSTVPINAPQFEVYSQAIATLKSTLDQIKSQVVTLD